MTKIENKAGLSNESGVNIPDSTGEAKGVRDAVINVYNGETSQVKDILENQTAHFLNDFFHKPTTEEMNKDYRYIPQEGNRDFHPKYDISKMAKEYFNPLLNQYFAYEDIMDEKVEKAFIALARGYAASDPDGRDDGIGNSSVLSAQYARLRCLTSNPKFISSKIVVDVIEPLSGLTGYNAEPWGYEYFEYYGAENGGYDKVNSNNNKYRIKKGFSVDQIEGFKKLVLCDKIWENKTNSSTYLLNSIGNALVHLYKSYPIEAIVPRVEMLRRGDDMSSNERWRFSNEEIEELRLLSKEHEFLKDLIDEIESSYRKSLLRVYYS